MLSNSPVMPARQLVQQAASCTRGILRNLAPRQRIGLGPVLRTCVYLLCSHCLKLRLARLCTSGPSPVVTLPHYSTPQHWFPATATWHSVAQAGLGKQSATLNQLAAAFWFGLCRCVVGMQAAPAAVQVVYGSTQNACRFASPGWTAAYKACRGALAWAKCTVLPIGLRRV